MNSYGKKCIKLYSLTLYFNLKGEYKNCCYQKKEYYQRLTNISTISKTKFIKGIISDMEKGIEHDACSHCYSLEKIGIDSPRIEYNNHYIQQKGFFPLFPSMFVESLYFRFNNLCNFACRMCNSYSSSARQKIDTLLEQEVSPLLSFPEEILLKIQNKDFLKHIHTIDIKGGEPLLHKEHFLFLEFLLRSNLAEKIELKYNTNLSIIPGITPNYNSLLPKGYENIFDMWKHFRKIYIRVSIEGYAKQNEYMRLGSDWEIFENNLETLKQYSYIDITLTSTIQIDNILSLLGLILFAQKKGIPLNISSHSFVHTPEYYNIRILPKKIKDKIALYYSHFIKKYYISDVYRKNLEAIIIYMYKSEENHELLKKYLSVTKKIDILYKKEKITKIYSMIEKYILSLNDNSLCNENK